MATEFPTIDFSLALINQTGAYVIGHDLISHLDRPFRVRYWRVFAARPPGRWARVVLRRAMMWELLRTRPLFGPWPRRPGGGDARVLFLDPLYLLHDRLSAGDAVLCHDIGPITHPDFYNPPTVAAYRRAYQAIAAAAPSMVFVSRWSRDQFLRHFPGAYPRTTVIPLYLPERLRHPAPVRPPRINARFVLMVGGVEKRKNHAGAIDGFLRLRHHDPGLTLVLAGPPGNAIEALERRIAGAPQIIYLNHVSDDELAWLYANCAAFVLPSLLEGFGMPAIEAPLMGAVPVLSQGTVFHEVAGAGAVYVDPLDPAAIADGLRTVLAMPADEKARRLAAIRGHVADCTFDRFIAAWRAAFDHWYATPPPGNGNG